MADRLRPALRRTRRIVALVALNLLIFLALAVVTNIASSLLLELSENASVRHRVHSIFGVGRTPVTDKADLPPYAGKEAHAREVWKELEQSKSVEYAPFVEWRRKPYRGKWVTVSDSGDRIYEPPTEPPPGAPVVRFFGGSSIWGTGAEDSQTIPAIYARSHPRYRVLNHGDAAYNSRQNLERLINLLARGERTDVAVFYEGFNDVLTLCDADTSLNGHNEEATIRGILEGADALGELFYGRTLQLLRKLRGPTDEKLICDTDPVRARRVAGTVMNIWRIARTLQQEQMRCGRLLVVLQPVAPLGRPRVDYLGDEGQQDPLADYDVYRRQLRAVYPQWQRAALRAANRSWLFDLTRAYDGDEPLYIDLVHVAPKGNAIMARRVAPLVERALADARRCRAAASGRG